MILPRQDSTDPVFESDDEFVYDSFWYTREGIIIKYIIFASFMGIFLLWFIGGYIHAQRRMKKGLAPLAYHKWLVPRYQRARFEPQMQGVVYYQYQTGGPQQYYAPGQNGYPMQPYAEPPPLYGGDMPPSYQPPPGATKADPQQQYAAPPGPPPSGPQAPQGSQQSGVVNNEPTPPAQAHHTGSSNPFRL